MAINYFWDRSAMDAANMDPNVLAIGDSWFWYPFPGGSLLNNLGRVVEPKGGVIYAKGNNGAEAFDYVDGKYAGAVREALRLYGSGLKAVFLSGGGNDFAGFNDLRPLLEANCSAAASGQACFQSIALDKFFEHVDTYYRRLIGEVYTYTSVDCKIVMHTYDYAVPDGRAVLNGAAWLKPALDDAKVPLALQPACIKCLIDRFHDQLATIAKNDPKHLFVVDSRGALVAGEWANELHPTSAGFRKIADQCWAPVLRDLQLA
jgi:hypothetical protein